MRFKYIFFVAAMIFSSIFIFSAARAQTKPDAKIAREIDRKKMNASCTGNFLAGAPNADGSIPADVENLSKIYDFDAFRAAAVKNRFKIVDERRLVPMRSIPIEEFNSDYNSGAPYK